MQRPRIPPVIEFRRDIQRIKTRADVANHPKDQPHRRPRLADDHRHILARKTQRAHAEEVDHPVHQKRGMPVRICVMCWYISWHRLVIKRYLEGERDEAVGKRHGEVGAHGGDPAVKDELVEVQGRVAGGNEELHVCGHVEGEGKEGDDDQVDQTDSDGRKSDGRMERAEVEL